MTSARTQQTRRPLSRKRILRAAVRHADAEGVDTLSMRLLARRLGFGVMSLYNHVSGKDDLLDGMVELVAAEIGRPDGDKPWKAAILEIAVSAHKVFVKHPWVNALWSHRGPGPAKLAHLESILRALREGGFSVAMACQAYHAVTMHIVGFTLQQLDFPIDKSGIKDAASAFLEQSDPDRIPYFVEHVRHHVEHPAPSDDFAFTLSLILDGLESNLQRS